MVTQTLPGHRFRMAVLNQAAAMLARDFIRAGAIVANRICRREER